MPRLNAFNGGQFGMIAPTVCGTGGGGIFSATVTPVSVNISGTLYKVYTYTSGGSIFVGSGAVVDVLIVGGGGGGGSSGSNGSGGGGGAGGLVYLTNYVPGVGTYNIVVGGGGAPDPGGYGNQASTNIASPGNPSSVFGYTALGGGRGGSPGPTNTGSVLDGGSGGGATGGGNTEGAGLQPGSASGGFGNSGGSNAPGSSGNQTGQGGGGAGAAGSGGATVAGNGGIGKQYDISGTLLYYAGGGGAGASAAQGAIGSGGSGGGASGGAKLTAGNNATFYGGGGGGAGANYPSNSLSGGSGYQGVVIIRQRI